LINLGQGEWPLTLGDAVFTAVFHTLESESADVEEDVRSKSDTLLTARTTAAHAFTNPLHDLYTDELEKHFAMHDPQLESRLRAKFSDEFFAKSQVETFVFKMFIALLVALVLVLKIPWLEIAEWLNPHFLK
jgi:hypothetical protein